MSVSKMPKPIQRDLADRTYIPKVFFDILPSLTSLAEVKILLCLFRHTYGLIKIDDNTYTEEYKISIRKLGKEVGVSHVSIIKGLKSLQYKNLIVRYEDENGEMSYALKIAR